MQIFKIFILLAAFLPASFSQSKNTQESSGGYEILDVNNVTYVIYDYDGSYPYSRSCGDAHWFLSKYEGNIVFDNGMWLVGKIQDSVKAGIREWWYQYSPGPIIDGKPGLVSHPEDSAKYRVYKISEGDNNSNPDYQEWPEEFGAPVDSNGSPKIYGDQMLWSVYNMLDTTTVPKFNSYYIPTNEDKFKYTLPIEVREKVYTHASISSADDDLLSNIIFIEYEFINKGEVQIDSTYWGFWTDIDFSPWQDNNPLIDTLRQLGLCYSFEGGENIPSVGYTLLYGPTIDSPGDVAIFRGKEVQNKMNLKLNTFHPIHDDSWYMNEDGYENPERANLYGPPYSNLQAWNVARGNGAFNYPYYDFTQGAYTNFPFSGNPVTQEGWYAYNNNPGGNGGGAGFVFFSGPFNFAPADTQWVMIALLPALGEDNFDSITKLRDKVDQLRAMPYDSLAISNRVVSSINSNDELKLDYSLKQNYPNPFNPTTRITYSIPETERVILEIYNVLGEKIVTLFDGIQQAGNHNATWNAESFSSGIYFYKLSVGSFIQTKKMMLVK